MAKSSSSKSSSSKSEIVSLDPVWDVLREEAQAILDNDPSMAGFIYANVLNRKSLHDSLIHRICEKLHTPDFSGNTIRAAFLEMERECPEWAEIVRVDIAAYYERDPACSRVIEPILYFKGFHAIQTHRLAHFLWHKGREDFALYLQGRASEVYQCDINPQSVMGRGIFIDHATGLVIGETASVGDNVSILHGVTLGGTGKESGNRHPDVCDGVLIGAGATILGNITIGQSARVAAGSLVLKPVPERSTVAGIPAKVVGALTGHTQPARSMNQILETDYGSA